MLLSMAMAQKEIVWHISDAIAMKCASPARAVLSKPDGFAHAGCAARYLAEVQHMKNGSSNSGSCSRMSELPAVSAWLRFSCRRGNCPIALMYSYNEALQPFFE